MPEISDAVAGALSSADPGGVLDAHAHFWDPASLRYRWLDSLPALQRAFGPRELVAAALGVPLDGIVFVEANCLADESQAEAEWVSRMMTSDAGMYGIGSRCAIVAFVDLTRADRLDEALDRLMAVKRVRGVRHNIQGQEPGFCLRGDFVEGVREVGRQGLTFDLCVTHDQLADVLELAQRCPETALALDHGGKPAIRTGSLDPWRRHIELLAEFPHVVCKLSGLLTEASLTDWSEEDLLPYAAHLIACFGPDRLMYGGDWPVVTLAGSYMEWYQFTRRLTSGWERSSRDAFYRGNALRFYGIE